MYHETEPMLGRSPTGKPGAAPVNVGSGSVRTMRLETPTARCNDGFFAFLFILQALVISIFALWKGIPALMKQVEQNGHTKQSQDYSMIFALATGLMAISVVFSSLWMKFLMSYAESMIRIALWMNVGIVLVFAFTTFVVNPFMALLFIGLAALNVWYVQIYRLYRLYSYVRIVVISMQFKIVLHLLRPTLKQPVQLFQQILVSSLLHLQWF